MNNHIDELLLRYQSKGALIDSNLLLLWVVGSSDRTLVDSFKRIRAYTLEDFSRLQKLMAWFSSIITTPHVLTEVSNLASQLPDHNKLPCFRDFPSLLHSFTELSVDSKALIQLPQFPLFGLTDVGISAYHDRYLLITDDARLYVSLERSGVDAINFNHLRSFDL